MEGKLETGVQADNRLNRDEALLEERGDFLYTDENITFGFSTAIRERAGKKGAEVYQLYLLRELKPLQYLLKAGRFEQADASGYYILDGASLRSEKSPFSLEVYGGKYTRVEDYSKEAEGSFVGGVEIEFPRRGAKLFRRRFGYQRITHGGETEEIVTWGVGAIARDPKVDDRYYEFFTEGRAIPKDKSIENFLAEVRGQFSNKKMFALGYEIYNPLKNAPSLRNSFYRLYASEREEILRVALSYKLSDRLSLYGKGRSVWRHSGKGYVGAFGVELERSDGFFVALDIDSLYLKGEKSLAFFVSSTKPVSSKMIVKLNGLIQADEKRTTGKNHALGLEASVEAMLKGRFSLSFSAMRIWNSRMNDEYMVGLRITRHFNRTSARGGS